ncbi:MAG: hypothetical protein JW726_16110 [Anaerolineales bacterium]|nr:hypothetical protein [Anaerolineales bacterium]
MRRIWFLPLIVLLVSLACSRFQTNTGTQDAPAVIETETPTPDPNFPHVELTIEPANPKVGELITVTADAVEIGMPYYYLFVQDEGAAEPAELGRATYSNDATGQEPASQIVQFVQVEASGNQATFTLLALAPGSTRVWVNATGEVQSEDGAWMWGGGGSESIVLTVTDR